MTNQYLKKQILRIILILISSYGSIGFAAVVPLPGSVAPGRVQQNYLPETTMPKVPTVAPKVQRPEQKAAGFGPEAKLIKFKLNKVILTGNHIYSTAQLTALFQNKLHREISIADLQDLVQDITNYYRNNGYILTRAILPPQRVANGIVRIQIIEGYIDQVSIVGTPRNANRIILDYGNRISASRPLQLKDMEYYLLLANQVPGATVKAILEPSKKQIGASDMSLSVEQQPIGGSLSYDNYGTLYIGPLQVTGSANANSVIRSGDMISTTYLAATHDKELHFFDGNYQTPLGTHGFIVTAGGNQSLTLPGFLLRDIGTHGTANTYYANFQYPVILSRSQYLMLDGGFSYVDSKVTQLDNQFLLYDDHMRPIRFGGIYSFADRWNGSNIITPHVEQGLKLFGASDDPQSEETSHFGADGIFTKFNLLVSHTQPIAASPLSVYFMAQGQTSNKPLLATEQFGFGGSVQGRGYDPAEILADRGIAGTLEVRFDTFPQKFLINNVQYYVYYDIGKVWDIDASPDPQVPQEQSAASGGFGARFSITQYISGNVMFTQALTKPIASEELIGRGKVPKIFFSLTAAV